MKYFKVIKENFLWEVGCILKLRDDKLGYTPIDDIFKKHDGNEYITKHIIEDSPEYFEQIYRVDLATSVLYEAKDRARELITEQYKWYL